MYMQISQLDKSNLESYEGPTIVPNPFSMILTQYASTIFSLREFQELVVLARAIYLQPS